jgi:tape measure domain-containing protein
MSFALLRAELTLGIQNFKENLRRAERETQAFSSRMARAAKDNEGMAEGMIAGYTRLNDRLHQFGFGLKDAARIFAGITISQGFYTITRNIREATSALWEFNKNLDYAHVTYSALFNDSSLASSFIDTLKDFSIDTIFEYTDIEGMARKLSAYGIEYKNLMYIIEGLTNLGTISGDTAALERLAVAIGQINAKGTLKAEEMRQLANAYVPIYDVLREKLHLTEEDLQRVGDLGIKSADAINAIIEYANETFGSTADAAVFTITGLNNRIVDTLKAMGSAIIEPITMSYKVIAKYIADGLGTIRDIYEQSGLGGVFEHLVPSKEWQARLRNLFATLQNSFKTIIAGFITLWPTIRQTFGGLIDAFTVFLGVLNTIAGAITGVIQSISKNTPALDILSKALITAAAAWLLFKVQALGAAIVSGVRVAIVGVANAVLFLARALTAHPIVTILTLLGATLIGVASNAKGTDSAIHQLIDTFNSFSIGGTVADDVLQAGDAMEQGADQSDKFWESMKDGAEDAEDSIEDAGNAAKKASKNLLSFDEVFRLQDNADSSGVGGSGLGALDGIGDLSDALSGLGSALIPEVPDLSGFAKDFVSTLYSDLWDAIKTIASGASVGAIIGGIAGFAIGGFVTKTMAGALAGAKLGTKIGAVVGGAFAGFWSETYKEMEASLQKIAVGGALGVLAGGLVGMTIGAFATRTLDGAILGAQNGARLGGLVGTGIGAFWAGMSEEMTNRIEGIVVGSGSGALMGAIAGFVIGAFSTKTLAGAISGGKLGLKIGASIGAVLGGILAQFEQSLTQWVVGLGAGAAYGALGGGLVGLLLGAFATRSIGGAKAGAILGAKVGAGVGAALVPVLAAAEGGIAGALSELFSGVAAASYGALFGGLAGMVIGAIVGVFAGGVGVIPFAKAGAAIGAGLGALGGFVYDKLKDSGIVESIVAWFGDVFSAIGDFFVKAGKTIGGFFSNIWNNVTSFFSKIAARLSSSATHNNRLLSNGVSSAGSIMANFFKGANGTTERGLSKIGASIVSWLTTTAKNTKAGWEGIFDVSRWKSGWESIKTWFSDLGTSIANWFKNIGSSISSWWNGLWSDKEVNVSASTGGSTSRRGTIRLGHARGGIFNREHIARFAEGNKAEAVIPLENAAAMQPFVDAISTGILQGIMPAMANGNSSQSLPPMYVGTLIADERGLQQLYKKFEVYEAKELARKGLS